MALKFRNLFLLIITLFFLFGCTPPKLYSKGYHPGTRPTKVSGFPDRYKFIAGGGHLNKAERCKPFITSFQRKKNYRYYKIVSTYYKANYGGACIVQFWNDSNNPPTFSMNKPEVVATNGKPKSNTNDDPPSWDPNYKIKKHTPSLAASGTGFIISIQGYILTNSHVIDECSVLYATINKKKIKLQLIAQDAINDIAVLKTDRKVKYFGRFSPNNTSLPGESVVVVGYPLRALGVLTTEAIVNTGTLSALAGLGNDSRYLQISAPVHPGNSGGPLLDSNGLVVGVVSSKVNAIKFVELVGDIPQNINFAIKASVAKSFLDAHGIKYVTGHKTNKLELPIVAINAKKFTVPIDCVR